MPSASWYLQRLSAMSAREMLFRARRTFATLLERFPSLRKSAAPPDWQALRGPATDFPENDGNIFLAGAAKLLQGRWDIFACRDYLPGQPPAWNKDPKTGVVAPLTFGKSIDYRDERIVGNIKYAWEPSRHLALPSLAQAYRVSGDRQYLDCVVRLIESWIRQCPYPNGIHWCSSLEVAIRLINWSLVWRIVGDIDAWRTAGADDDFLHRWLQSIYRHMQFIDGYYSAYSSANNHLIGEAAGVYVGAATWPAWPDVGRLRNRARQILVAEAHNQTHADGVNAEQATAYQQFVLDFFIVAGLAARRIDDALPASYWDNVERMLQFISSLMDVGGNVPMIGDADDGFVVDLAPEPDFCNYRSLLATGAILFRRPDFARKAGTADTKTRWLIENAEEKLRNLLSSDRHSAVPTQVFEQGGYYIMGHNFESSDEIRIVFDAGPLGMGSLAAHGHADALAFHLSVSGTPFIIDPGTYAYHTEKVWRDYFRGTSAHNTVRIDGLNQSEIGGSFLWKTHAKATVAGYRTDSQEQFVDASHDGYLRLKDPVTHRRILSFDARRRSIRIEDYLDCTDVHDVEIFFHFPEYASISNHGDCVEVRVHEDSIQIQPEHQLAAEHLYGDEGGPAGWISYRFDSKLPSGTLRYTGRIKGATMLATTISVN